VSGGGGGGGGGEGKGRKGREGREGAQGGGGNKGGGRDDAKSAVHILFAYEKSQTTQGKNRASSLGREERNFLVAGPIGNQCSIFVRREEGVLFTPYQKGEKENTSIWKGKVRFQGAQRRRRRLRGTGRSIAIT